MSTLVDIKLKKVDKVYHEGVRKYLTFLNCLVIMFIMFQEKVTGLIVINSNSDLKHDGITLIMEGYVNLQLSSKNVGILEAFYNSVKVYLYINILIA